MIIFYYDIKNQAHLDWFQSKQMARMKEHKSITEVTWHNSMNAGKLMSIVFLKS